MSQQVVNIRQAKRAGARLVIGLSGISGSGKTKTGLLLAYGLANGNGSKVGFLDTENRRGSLYADNDLYSMVQQQLGLAQPAEPFLIADLDAPHSPQRYTDAILAFQNAGVEVLVIDSVSHEWEGIGGCEEIAERGAVRGSKDWKTAKAEHKKFMNTLLASNMHIIVCLRAREKVKYEKIGGKTEVIPQGILPVCEKNFMFELTASMMMWDGGKSRDVVKSSGVEAILGEVGQAQGYLTADTGRQIRAWVDGGEFLDPDVEAARNHLRSISEQGMDAYRTAWGKMAKKVRDALMADGSHESLKLAAEAFDKAKVAGQPGGEELDELNKELGVA
ncbi:AAA family ATPase [Dyella sp. 2RAF44]|uniref:AAA family ATPase n=1 Tax=Dyella sp. 2RAF44 TaxID=3233000 RepID=UPI003F91AAEA